MKKILFIGNSHTYFHDLPYIFRCFTESEQAQKDGVEPMFSAMICHGGRMLCEHLREPEIHYNLKFGDYDYVVLQQAAHPFPGKEALLSDGKALCDMIRSSENVYAQPVAYMTWAEKAYPEHQQIMIESYTQLAAENHAILAPVGAVWQSILQDENNTVDLYYTDGEHASLEGTYLAACVLYASITGKSPIGLPHLIAHRGDILYALSVEDAAYLQKKTAEYLSL